MENGIVIKRANYLKTLMILVSILFFVVSSVLHVLYNRTDIKLYLVGGILTDAVGGGFVLYIVALFMWRVRFDEDSVYVRIWYKGETKYNKNSVIVADAGTKNYLPNDNGKKVLGNRYIIWSKETQKPITDVYDRDINSQYIKDMCVDK